MRKEVIFSDFDMLINEKDKISKEYEKEKWKLFSYSTGMCSGSMLVTPDTSYPDDLSLDLNLTGLYHIYICLPKLSGSANYINFKLSDDLAFFGIKATSNTPCNWITDEFVEEVYWKTADLTNQKFFIRKSKTILNTTSGIAWIRCVPAEEKPTYDNKCLQMHIDEDIVAIDSLISDNDYLARLYPLKDSNAEFVSFEFSFDYSMVPHKEDAHLLHRDYLWDVNMYKYFEKKDMIYKNAVKYAKESGFGIYATNRMQVGNFVTSYTRCGWNMKFVDDNPQFRSRTRIGTRVDACSYAYPEVQDFVIAQFENIVKYGFDGISLIFHRGHYIAFDEPVIERFKKLYPDINPHQLPIADERLHGVWCEIMNEFMFKLRKAVGKDIKINVITDYGLETSKHIGLDVEYWAKTGLVDSVSQADMEIFEDLEGCMDDNNPELIDLEKYKYQLTQRTVVRRIFCKNTEKVLEHIEEYKKLEDYGVTVYHVLPWMFTTPPDEYNEIVKSMKDKGATKFLCWNTNHLITDLPEWHTAIAIGNEPTKQTLRQFHRVLTFNGSDVSQLNPNWRG